MNVEAIVWIRYASDNRQTALLCIENHLLNPSIQNSQQAVEKALKSLCLTLGIGLKKTHSISGLRLDLNEAGIDCGLTDEDCDLLDAVYLPSKYPLGSVLPDFEPDEKTAARCLSLANKVLLVATKELGRHDK